MHVFMFVVLILFFRNAHLGWLGLVGVIATGALLVYQHSIVRADDLSRLNAAFFTTNAFVSIILFVTMAGDALLFR
jgi:4-hydroxybenzoate polyprenyltransferase